MKICLIICLLFIYTGSDEKRKNFFVEGRVVDARTQEPIVLASVFLDKPRIGIQTNESGHYKLQIPDSLLHKRLILFCKYVGMNNAKKKIRMKNHSIIQNFELTGRTVRIDLLEIHK